jgi:hypothetical protein
VGREPARRPERPLQAGGATTGIRVRPASRPELDRHWPQLTKLWPAYQAFYDGGKRSVFVLEPADPSVLPVGSPRQERRRPYLLVFRTLQWNLLTRKSGPVEPPRGRQTS